MNEENQASNLARTVRKLLLYKYIAIILALLFFSGVLWHYFRLDIKAKEVWTNCMIAVLTAFVVTLFYDLFTRREQSLQLEEDRANTLRHLSKVMWTHLDITSLTPADREALARRFLAHPETVQSIAMVLSGQTGADGLALHLAALSRGDILCDVEITNKLRASGNDAYTLDFLQRFNVSSRDKREFLVVSSCDNDLFSILVAAPVTIDSLVGVSSTHWSCELPTPSHLALKAYKTVDGKRMTLDLNAERLSKTRLEGRLGRLIPNDKTLGFLYTLPAEPESFHFALSYQVTNSLDDPYYSWFAENPMLLKSVAIDYLGMKEAVGSVSANCFIGNYAYEPVHDVLNGVYRIDVDGLVWPGQGALIVWHQKNRFPPSAKDVN